MLRLVALMILVFVGHAHAQANVRGTNEATNEYPVKPLRSPPRIVWEVKPPYRDSGALAVSTAAGILVTGNINGTGGTFAYDTRTGKKLWSVPGHLRGDPAIEGGAVYVVNAQDNNVFRLAKLDLRTGKQLWRVEGNDLGGHDGPPVVSDGRVFLVNLDRSVAAYDAQTGKLVWRHEHVERCSSAMVASDGLVVLHGGLERAERTLSVLDAATGKLVWSVVPLPGDCPQPSVIAGGMLITRAANQLFAYDLKTGAPRWKQEVVRTEGERERRYPLRQLTVTGGVVYTSIATAILGFELATGRRVFELAHVFPPDPNDHRMAAAGGVLFVHGNLDGPVETTNGSGMLYAIDLKTKQVLWKFNANALDRKGNQTGTWSTRYLMPVDDGLYFENAQRLVRLGGAAASSPKR